MLEERGCLSQKEVRHEFSLSRQQSIRILDRNNGDDQR